MASYFVRTPVGLLLFDANFEEVRKSNSPGFKKNSGLYGKYIYIYPKMVYGIWHLFKQKTTYNYCILFVLTV